MQGNSDFAENDALPIVTIKKYANRRLYNTAASTYVKLEDLAEMVRGGADFIVLDAKTGEVKFQQRLEPRPGIVYSSSIIADGKWFCVSQHNGTYVMDAKPAFKLLSHNAFSKESSRTNACPIVHNNQLLIRSDKFLYCIGN